MAKAARNVVACAGTKGVGRLKSKIESGGLNDTYFRLAQIVLVASLVAGLSQATFRPNRIPKPLDMIVPFAAGGSPDIIGRMVAEDLATALG